MNSIGQLFRLSTFGESHGTAIGGIVDGCPAGLSLDVKDIQKELDRRKPGQSSIATARKESDTVQILSGLFEGKTTGAPIGFLIPNQDQRTKDYSNLKDVFRPSHADFTYDSKYGFRNFKGGGRSSARETANWVVAGAIAKQLLHSVNINAFVSSIGEEILKKPYQDLDFKQTENNLVRCPDAEVAIRMITAIEQAKAEGDSLGGTITCVAQGVPAGWGEPIFDKLHARLGQVMLSINAVKGFEYGSGFSGAKMKGSEHNDIFTDGGKTTSNLSGGIQGGISNGMDIYFRVAFKPTATIKKEQSTINKKGETVKLQVEGRHDPCVVPRAVPIVEAMTAMVLADFYLLNKNAKI